MHLVKKNINFFSHHADIIELIVNEGTFYVRTKYAYYSRLLRLADIRLYKQCLNGPFTCCLASDRYIYGHWIIDNWRDKGLISLQIWLDEVAEEVGFEPTEDFHPRWFSRPVH